MTEWVSFDAVKKAVPMSLALARYSVILRKVNGAQLRGKCPLPTHPAGERQTFSVNVDKSVWKCFDPKCRKDKPGGNVLDFVAIMESCNIREAALLLSREAGIGEPSAVLGKREVKAVPSEETKKTPGVRVASPNELQITPREEPVNTPLAWEFKPENLDFEHPYVLGRIKPETARLFGVGFYKGSGKTMFGRVVIPIRNEKGELVAYAGRSVSGEEPRYKLPAGFHKGLVLWNLHRVVGESVIVCEGYFASMRVHEAGFPNVVALMGSSMSPDQEKLLDRFKYVTLFLDADEAGKKASAEIALKLARTRFVRIVEFGQPDSLSNEEIAKALT